MVKCQSDGFSFRGLSCTCVFVSSLPSWLFTMLRTRICKEYYRGEGTGGGWYVINYYILGMLCTDLFGLAVGLLKIWKRGGLGGRLRLGSVVGMFPSLIDGSPWMQVFHTLWFVSSLHVWAICLFLRWGDSGNGLLAGVMAGISKTNPSAVVRVAEAIYIIKYLQSCCTTVESGSTIVILQGFVGVFRHFFETGRGGRVAAPGSSTSSTLWKFYFGVSKEGSGEIYCC